MPSHAVVLQGIWVRAARAREGVWAIGQVQLQVSVWLRPAVRASPGLLSPPKGGSSATSLAVEDLLGRE